MTIRRAPTLKTGTFSRFQILASLSVRNVSKKGIKKLSKQEQAHQGNYTNIETEVKNMTETTYNIIAKNLDRISMELHQADENNDFLRIGLLSGQLKAIKENLHRLLWIELPELNESHKIEAVSKSTTGMFFHPGIFEMDAMRQAFFKRQAKHFFDNEAEQQAYIEHAEKEYLEATITLKDILFNSKNANQKVSKDHLIEQFEEAMQ